MPYFLGDISAFQTRNCQKPVDTPLRGNVPRSALAVGVDYLIRAVFFRHVRKAAAPFQDVCRRVVEKQNEAGILLHPLNTVSGIPLSKFSNISLSL